MATPFTVFSGTDNTSLASALLAPGSGISINTSSIELHASGSEAVNFYDGSLAPLGIGSGLLLTTGITPGTSNTVGWYGQGNGYLSGNYFNGDASIDAVVNTVFSTVSYDATTLSFDFTVIDPNATSVSFDIVFGSDEYPEWVDQFVDCAIVMVNGVNYALFNHDPLHPLSVVSSNLAAGYFQDNTFSVLPIEYDGVSYVLKIVAPINGGGLTNRIKIGVADTGDHIYDSGIFISNLSAGNTPGGGIVVVSQGVCTDGNDSMTGSAQDELFVLKGGDDSVYAGGGDDIVSAGAGNDLVYGGSGNDEILGEGGNDSIDGGDGLTDTADYSGASAGYGVGYDALSGTFTITDSNTGAGSEGIDTLKGVEYLRFSDGLFELGVGGLTPVSSTGTPAPSNTPGTIAVSGLGSVGSTLTAMVSDPDGISGAIGYQWQLSADNGASWSDISGATGATYVVSAGDVDTLVQVSATYSDNASQTEFLVSDSKPVFAPTGGDLVVTLLQLDAPPGTSIINPLTTLMQNAVELGLSANEAMFVIKEVLGIPAQVSLQSYDAYGVLQSLPTEQTALAVEKVAVQVAILTSLSDDDTGMNLTLAILNAGANNLTLDLADLDDLCFILGIDPQAALPDFVSVIYDRNRSMSDAIADGGDVNDIENEWVDLCGLHDGINSTSIADLSIHLNQSPSGSATFTLPVGFENEVYTMYSADLLEGYSDPDGDALSVSWLSANAGGFVQDNGDGTWSFIPDSGYSGPVELGYTVVDGQGGAIVASQLFVMTAVQSSGGNNAPTGEMLIVGNAVQGETLSADTTTLADADGLGAIVFQWQADGFDIIGANESTFTLTQAAVGMVMTISVSYTDGLGNEEIVFAAGTVPVVNVDDAASGTLSVTGAAEEGGVLVAELGGVVDPDGATTTSWQWEELSEGNWVLLDGQVDSTLLVPSDQSFVGHIVRVVATTLDEAGGSTLFEGDALTIADVNDAPTLTGFSGAVEKTEENGVVELSFADLVAAGDEADEDGMVKAFVVQSVTTGTLMIGSDVGSATLWASAVNDTIDAGQHGYWSPGADTSGLLEAFTVVAKDNGGLESATPMQVTVEVTNVIQGTIGKDTISGSTSDDHLYGYGGNDTLSGFHGNDLLDGGAGADRLEGGAGDDVYLLDNTGDVVVELTGSGTDTVRASVNCTLSANVENLTLTGSDAINGKGNVLANVINGNDAANVLNGATGADTISGAGGNDTINGGTGIDVMSGGDGLDLFVFDYLAKSETGIVSVSHDIITDFVSGQDRLDLTAIDANAGVSGNQVFDSALLSAMTPFSSVGQLRFDSVTGMLSGNTDSNLLTAEFTIQLTGLNSLATADVLY
ncbi:MAG: cadherin-like domain-containing protein [Chlorobiaceae bacterium]|nr:cadherin-like domain-containing protein [Chlorobiaceae bacterium]